MAPWIQYMHKKVHELLRKAFVQVLIYREQTKSATIYKDFNLSTRYHCFSECSEDSKKCRVHLMKQVEARLPSKTVWAVLVAFMDILPAAITKKIIETEI